MKKSKKFLVLAATAAGLLSLVACNEVTPKENVIISFNDVNGDRITYTANELFEKYTQSSQDSTTAYYNALYNAMVRGWFNLPENEAIKKECDKDAEIEVTALKTNAENNASNNGTSYDNEWEKILNSELSDIAEDKRTDAELLLKKQLSAYKVKLEDEYYNEFKTWKKDNVTDSKQSNNLFWGDKGYLKERLPYHVRHILINVDAASGAYYNGKISKTNVEDLYSAINQLANGTNFGLVAQLLSDDTASAEAYGDLGIMDTSTSYVNEFKLGLYAYDTYFNTNSEIAKALEANGNPFNIPEEDAEYIKSLGIAEIPFGAIVKMNELRDVTVDNEKKLVNDGDETYYPRNILFNKYFNNHNLAFITPDNLAGQDPVKAFEGDKLNEHYTDLSEDGEWANGSQNPEWASLRGFQNITLRTYDVNGNATGTQTKKVLCDNLGNPIIVVRAGTTSYQGIHFITVQRSALEETKTYTTNGESYEVKLNEYYASENPLTSNGANNSEFPQTASNAQMTTYVNSYEMTYEQYNERVLAVKNSVKNFDTNYEMRIFEWLKNELKAQFGKVSGLDLQARIDEHIQVTRDATDENLRVTNVTTWDEFIEQLQVQQSQRKTKLIPETCALHFKEGFKDNANSLVKEACYHEK